MREVLVVGALVPNIKNGLVEACAYDSIARAIVGIGERIVHGSWDPPRV